MTDYTLWHGDCLEEMSRIEDGSVDAIICDLPFGVTANNWDVVIPFEPLWKQYKRVIKKNGAIVLFGIEPFSSRVRLSNLSWYKYDWVWDKVRGVGFQIAKRRPMMRHENIMVFGQGAITYNPQMELRNEVKVSKCYGQSKSSPLKYNDGKPRTYTHRYPTSILEYSNAYQGDKVHSTQKNLDLMVYLVLTYTNEGDTVLDSTCGSGSTLEAAMRNNRRSIGIEKDAGYFEIASQRLARVAAELRGELNHLPMFAGQKA